MTETDPDDTISGPDEEPSRFFWTLTLIGMLALLALCVVLAVAASRP
jgi:hypothetical protein